MSADGLTFKCLSGAALAPHVPKLARLRIEVFREFPYLYDGDEAYERVYLQTYINSARSLAVLVLDGNRLIGASTGVPMQDETEEFQRPFLDHGYDLRRIFYCGESALRPDYRGRGVYRHLFQARERHARALGGFDLCTFCRVQREPSHSLRPRDHVPLDRVWQRFGYAEHPSLTTQYAWKDIGQPQATAKTMRFWMKTLEPEPVR
ncbi:MAG: GNAT family N-acetyltransferase [Rudaea sp.]|nr:GNAT family N-acetyltransferase [Rudaea sp.]